MAAKKGRPKGYTEKIAKQICDQIAEGRSLRSICKQVGYPNKSIVFRWLLDDSLKDFRDQYAQAREIQAQGWADDIIEIADDGENDTYIDSVDDEGVVRTNYDNIQRSRLRVDARKWVLSKLIPKKYGDKIEVETEVKDSGLQRYTVELVPKSSRDE